MITTTERTKPVDFPALFANTVLGCGAIALFVSDDQAVVLQADPDCRWSVGDIINVTPTQPVWQQYHDELILRNK